jgi:hypothetical protein
MAMTLFRSHWIRSGMLMAAVSTSAWAQNTPKVTFAPAARVTLQIDSTWAAEFRVRGLDLRVSSSDPSSNTPTEIELVKQAGAHTGTLVRLSASGIHAGAAVIDVLDTLGQPALTLRLTDVVIVSDHLSLSTTRATLEQQRISQQEALSALTADFQDAQRELVTAEELNKSRGNTRMDLARARDRATDLQRRIDLLKQRQALLASQQAEQGPLDETVVLRFARLEIESREAGGRAAVDIGRRPPPRG